MTAKEMLRDILRRFGYEVRRIVIYVVAEKRSERIKFVCKVSVSE